jgi:hypothetical protein
MKLTKSDKNQEDNLKEKYEEQDELQQPKKRGRPRKEENKHEVKIRSSQEITTIKANPEDEQIILRLPIYDDDDDDLNSVNSEKNVNLFTMKDDSETQTQTQTQHTKQKNTIISLSDDEFRNFDINSDIDSDNINIKKILDEMKKKDIIIKKLRSDIAMYKEINYANSAPTNKDLQSKMLDLKLINIKENKLIIVDKTNIACFWCTDKFDGHPCFLYQVVLENIIV